MKRIVAMLLVLMTIFTVSLAGAGSWKQDTKGWWWQENNGSYPTSTWKKIKKAWYYFGSDGYMVTGWLTLNGKTYHLASNGKMDTGWKTIGSDTYYFNSDGEMVKNTTVKGKYLGADGKLVEGGAPSNPTPVEPVAPASNVYNGFVQIDGQWYYYMNGRRLTGTQVINGITYYFYSNGAMAANTWIGDSYFDSYGRYDPTATREVTRSGWTQIQGDWYYFYSNGSYAVNTWINGSYFGPDGKYIPYYTYEMTQPKQTSSTTYVAIVLTGDYHRSGCSQLNKYKDYATISSKNKEALELYGYTRCPICNP